MHTILVVEDERAVARGLVYRLEQEGFKVEWVQTGAEALSKITPARPHLILLDIRLPDLSGFDVCRQVRAAGARQPILMLTARDEPIDKVLGLELGADDYVVKPYDLRELIARIRAQLRRTYGELAGTPADGQIWFGPIGIDLEKMQVRKDEKLVQLTPTEYRILRYLAERPGRPASRSELVDALWGYTSDINSERTIDVHIRHLRSKLEDDPSEPRWIQTVRGVGYKLEP